jgi:hypothetical protein
MFDEALLKRLDSNEEVKKHGRSAVLRAAADEYLKQARTREIDEAYRRAYANGWGDDDEFAGWEDEAVWPDDWKDDRAWPDDP